MPESLPLPASKPASRRILAISCGFSFAIVVAVLTALAFSERDASAVAYTASFGPGNWNNAATWFPSGIPGSAAGDTVTIQSAVTFPAGFNTANPIAGMQLDGALIIVSGRVTAYGSVIDQVTTAPAYVAAQLQQ